MTELIAGTKYKCKVGLGVLQLTAIQKDLYFAGTLREDTKPTPINLILPANSIVGVFVFKQTFAKEFILDGVSVQTGYHKYLFQVEENKYWICEYPVQFDETQFLSAFESVKGQGGGKRKGKGKGKKTRSRI